MSLILVADPMCSWCYAFEPELNQVRAHTGLEVRLVMGGLYVADRARPLDDDLRTYLRNTWNHVGRLSGRRFAFDLIDWPTWTYDTGPACRAVVAMRTVAPEQTLAYFELVQHAFYADNLDVTRPEVLLQLADSVECDRARFAALLTNNANNDLVRADYAEARALGATGFPMLLLDTGSHRVPVSTGYNPAARVLRTIDVLS